MNAATKTEAKQIRVDWFHRPERKHLDKNDTSITKEYTFYVPADAGLEQILEIGHRDHNMPKGSARGGCFELQTDLGIWSSPTDSRLNPRSAIFKTWEQLEAEEA